MGEEGGRDQHDRAERPRDGERHHEAPPRTAAGVGESVQRPGVLVRPLRGIRSVRRERPLRGVRSVRGAPAAHRVRQDRAHLVPAVAVRPRTQGSADQLDALAEGGETVAAAGGRGSGGRGAFRGRGVGDPYGGAVVPVGEVDADGGPGACLTALVRDSWTTRWTVRVIKGERRGGSPSRCTSAATPASRALRTSASTDSAAGAVPGASTKAPRGAVPGASSSARSTVRVSRRCPTASATSARSPARSARSCPLSVGDSSSAPARSAMRLS